MTKNWIIDSCNIMVTSKCNLNCSFCSADKYMKSSEESLMEHIQRIKDYVLNRTELKQICWYGGEPLLLPKRLEQYINTVSELRPDVNQTVFTNGLNLKMGMVDMLSKLERLSFSIDGFSGKHRSLDNFSKQKAFEAFEVFKEMSKTNVKLEINSIITRDDLNNPRWYETLIELYQATLHLGFDAISISLDNMMPKPLNTDHVLNLIYGYKTIDKHIRKILNDEISIELRRFFSNYNCWQCSHMELMDSSGYINIADDVEIKNDFGCNSLVNAVGRDAYIYITKFIETYRN